MKEEAREYYHFLLTVCQDENIPLVTVYRQLREFLERLCRTQMPDGSLQMTDLSARVSFVASKVGLSVVEQNRLHTFRLTSNAVLNRQSEPSRENLLRDIKTLTFFVKRLTGEDIPAELYHQLPVRMPLILLLRLQKNGYAGCVSASSMLTTLFYMYCL